MECRDGDRKIQPKKEKGGCGFAGVQDLRQPRLEPVVVAAAADIPQGVAGGMAHGPGGGGQAFQQGLQPRQVVG